MRYLKHFEKYNLGELYKIYIYDPPTIFYWFQGSYGAVGQGCYDEFSTQIYDRDKTKKIMGTD